MQFIMNYWNSLSHDVGGLLAKIANGIAESGAGWESWWLLAMRANETSMSRGIAPLCGLPGKSVGDEWSAARPLGFSRDGFSDSVPKSCAWYSFSENF